MQNSNQTGNYALTGVAKTMRSGLPVKYLVGVILSYLVNAGLIAFLLYPIFLRIAGNNSTLALWVVVPGAAVVQFFRYLLVFTDQLIPNGVQSSRGIVRFVAFAMWVFSCVEVYHATAGIEWLTGSQFWSLALFGIGIVSGGWVLEISFVKKMNELTDLQVGEAYESDEEVRERVRQEQDAARAQHSPPTQSNGGRSYSPAELQQMMQEAVQAALDAQQGIKNRPEMERVAAEMQEMNGNSPKVRETIAEYQAQMDALRQENERLKALQTTEAAAEGIPYPLDLAAINSNGNGHTLQNRVVISGFQPQQVQDANATFIKQPLQMGQKACEHCDTTFTAKVAWQKFCTSDCRDSYHTAKHGKPFNPALHHNQKP